METIIVTFIVRLVLEDLLFFQIFQFQLLIYKFIFSLYGLCWFVNLGNIG